MAIRKNGGGADTNHRGYLHWIENQYGIPYRTQVRTDLLLYKQELQRCKPCYDFHSRKFDLNDEKEKQEYDEIMDHILNGWYRKLERLPPTLDPATGKFLVYLEWGQPYIDIPLPTIINASYGIPSAVTF